MGIAGRISYAESLSIAGAVYIDVRSPSEYAEDTIPGAVNMPVFDDDERAEVGTLYKHSGKHTAVIRATEIGGGKIAEIIKSISALNAGAYIFMCARGGMRSGTIAAFTASLGFTTFIIDRGYRDYRAYVMNELNSLAGIPPLFVLQGLTGSGKTEIIRIMEPALDLEAMAGHRSSLFGGIGLVQRRQKGFESQLLNRINSLRGKKFILTEGESRKIGNLHIHPRFFEMMLAAPQILLTTPLEKRVEIILKEYSSALECDEVEPILNGLNLKLGKKTVDELISLYRSKRFNEFVAILLEKYYDPLYMHTMSSHDYLFEIEWSGAPETAALLEKKISASAQ